MNNTNNQSIIDEYKDSEVKYLSYFSMSELIPILEKEISSIKDEEYMVDYFITNIANSNIYEVRYLAFPKREEYIKALFSYKNLIVSYTKSSKSHDSIVFERISTTNNIDFKDALDIRVSDKVHLIAQENIHSKQLLNYLCCPPEEAYLSDFRGYEYQKDSFFCYDQEFDQLGDTIFGFAKKKLPNK